MARAVVQKSDVQRKAAQLLRGICPTDICAGSQPMAGGVFISTMRHAPKAPLPG